MEEGDRVVEIQWRLENQEEFTSTLILDKTSKPKFDSFMYFIPTEIQVYGSSHKLKVNNAFTTVIEGELFGRNIASDDECNISRDNEERIPHFEKKESPLWYAEYTQGVIWHNKEGCDDDYMKKIDCADIWVDVDYQSVFPLDSITIKKVSFLFENTKMSSGNRQLNLEICSMEPVFVDNVEQGKLYLRNVDDVFIEEIEGNPEKNSITLHLSPNSNYEGKVNLVLPRNIIDSKDDNGDENFIVLFDHTPENNMNERIFEDPLRRFLEINVPKNTERIEIVGTSVIPEFGIYIFLIFPILMILTIIVGQNRKFNYK